MGVVNRLEEQTKGTLEFLDDSLDKRGEAQVGVFAPDVLCELCNSLGVGLGLELEALALKQRLEFFVVCDDAIVYDGELPTGVRPGDGGGAVGGPSRVGNAGVRVEDLVEVEVLLINKLLERSDLANLLDGVDLVLLVTIDGETGRVVATVF
ncbi:GlmS Glucosamine 6-phosphate synthetase contains amidotransferase and phosphosugar isomerase domain [Pyrenophora tritici-repentis]|nr:GlmS Glucosamine 6-phosphate synthetase contains amidotransferase and phosphosugar isomerase domain [Pyrenophora tritici-repentis]